MNNSVTSSSATDDISVLTINLLPYKKIILKWTKIGITALYVLTSSPLTLHISNFQRHFVFQFGL
jgi:hypothetical protein